MQLAPSWKRARESEGILGGSGRSEAGMGAIRTPGKLLTFVSDLQKKVCSDRTVDRYRTALNGLPWYKRMREV